MAACGKRARSGPIVPVSSAWRREIYVCAPGGSAEAGADRLGRQAPAMCSDSKKLSSELAELSSQFLSLVDGTVVHKADGDWAAGNSSRHALAEVQRRASLQCGIDRVAIDLARFDGHLVA
jgi:hypothetical protein